MGYKQERVCVYGLPPGLGAVFIGRGTGHLPDGFGLKLSGRKNMQRLSVGPIVGGHVALWPGRRKVHPNILAGGLWAGNGGWVCSRVVGLGLQRHWHTWALVGAGLGGASALSRVGRGQIAWALGPWVRSRCCSKGKGAAENLKQEAVRCGLPFEKTFPATGRKRQS